MPNFAIEVVTLMAPTEIYDQLGPDTPEGWDKETRVFVVVATYRNTINWLVLGEMNKDSQKFRDEIYVCASRAHNTLERGCGKYYRGTNSVHVKRLHSDPFESMYNHNHYPLGGLKGADFDARTFPDDVTPEEFTQHVLAFAKADKEMHGGIPRFLTEFDARRIAEEFRKNHVKELAAQKKAAEELAKEQKTTMKLAEPTIKSIDEPTTGSEPSTSDEPVVSSSISIPVTPITTSTPSVPATREYTLEDIEELKTHQHEEQPCKAPEGVANTRGIGSERADERQPPEYDRKDYEYVKEFRAKGQKLIKDVEATVKMVREQKAMQAVLKEAVKTATPGSAVEIASSAFTKEVSEEIALHAKVGVILAELLEKEITAASTVSAVPPPAPISDYNLGIIDKLKEQLVFLSEKSPRTKSTLPGFKQIVSDVRNVQLDTISALITACEKHDKTKAIDFISLLNNYQTESNNGLPLEFVESLKTLISQVEPPISIKEDKPIVRASRGKRGEKY